MGKSDSALSSEILAEPSAPAGSAPESGASGERTTAVAARLAELRKLATTDPQRAQDEIWQWFMQLGKARALGPLDELFRSGKSLPMSGNTDGIFMCWTNPVMHKLVTPLIGPGAVTMPWWGKWFDAQTMTGANRFKPWWPPVSKLGFPLYHGHRKQGGEDLMFNMENGDIDDPMDPGHTIWKIDYRGVDGSPWFIKHCLDTLVELTPNTHLGRLYYDRFGKMYNLLYFALKSPVPR